jgi:4-hydroxybenzoate polyprenyltransferase
MGAVYNNEYLKAITYFAVFASLVMMGDRVNGVFGFGAFAFMVFTMFDAYRTAELKARKHIGSGGIPEEPPHEDRTIIGWGVFLIILGILFLLQNIIPYYFLNRLWPLVFVLLGAYLVYRALCKREDPSRAGAGSPTKPKEDI